MNVTAAERLRVMESIARLGIADTQSASEARATLGRLATQLSANVRFADDAAVDALPLVDLSENGSSAEFVTVREIGRGGMGVVLAAMQRSIRREVAVKRVTPGDSELARSLVREGRIMGSLEHPSIVPVHLLGRADDLPVIVMKRLEGATWRDLLDDIDHPTWAALIAGHGDRLRADIEILSQLCRALSFAHSRGVVHRDLKPENVMIGRFGEVTLLDWGIALRLEDRALEPPGIVGTPAYLAPEMALGDATGIDARTDVYLLGAMLCELLTGRPIHATESVEKAIVSAYEGRIPAQFGDAPADLVELVRTACARDPEHRPSSAEAFRERLEQHLAMREIDRWIDDAVRATERAEAAIAVEGASSRAANQALIEARFGFSSALRSRAHDERARAGLDRALRATVAVELVARNPVGARTALEQLASPPSALVASVVKLEHERGGELRAADELATAARQADVTRATPTVMAVLLFFVLVWAALVAWTWLETPTDTRRYDWLLVMRLDALLLGLAGFGFAAAHRWFTDGARRFANQSFVLLASIPILDFVSKSLGVSVSEAGVYAMTSTGITMACLAILRPVLWIIVVSSIVAAVTMRLAPTLQPIVVGLWMIVSFATQAFVVREERRAAGTAA